MLRSFGVRSWFVRMYCSQYSWEEGPSSREDSSICDSMLPDRFQRVQKGTLGVEEGYDPSPESHKGRIVKTSV